MRTKKASKKNAAAEPARTTSEVQAAAATQPAPETQAAIGLNGVTVDGGRANIAVSLDIPQPTMAENQRWPWTPWNVAQLSKQVEKDLRRLAQTVANLEHVSRTVESHASARVAAKAERPAAAQPQPAAERPGVAQ
jgi:hypothetical protein